MINLYMTSSGRIERPDLQMLNSEFPIPIRGAGSCHRRSRRIGIEQRELNIGQIYFWCIFCFRSIHELVTRSRGARALRLDSPIRVRVAR